MGKCFCACYCCSMLILMLLLFMLYALCFKRKTFLHIKYSHYEQCVNGIALFSPVDYRDDIGVMQFEYVDQR